MSIARRASPSDSPPVRVIVRSRALVRSHHFPLAPSVGVQDGRMHEKERFVRSGGVFGLDDVVGDFDASGVEAVREFAGLIRTQPREGVRSAMARGGSAAQSKFQLFPGDCDFFERVHIQADSREDAVEVLAGTMIESVAETFTNPHLQFGEMKLGLYPAPASRDQEPVSPGSPISWGLTDM